MQVTRGLAPRLDRPVALTIGNFDGVHKGHQQMLSRLVRAARTRDLSASVLTFEPHPRELFTPAAAPTRLTSLRDKLKLLAAQGIDHVHVQHFSRAFAALSPDAFVERLLVEGLHARWVLVGEDFRYGAVRAGNCQTLQQAAARHGFELETMPTVTVDGERVSSSSVRAALARGDLELAERLLGRRYSISGRVVHGLKLGRELGYATANVQMKHNRPPLAGIFAVRVYGIGEGACDGVASLGLRPTVASDGRATLEVHLFDFQRDIYGEHLRVEFLAKIRDEEKYPDLQTLKAQIARDCAAARGILEKL